MAIDAFKRLNYLNEITEKLIELDSSEEAYRLTSFYGLTSKEICFKNIIKSFRWDKFKLKRCSKCYAYIDFNLNRFIDLKKIGDNKDLKRDLNKENNEDLKIDNNSEKRNTLSKKINFKVKNKHFIIQCKQCNFKKSFIISSKHKTLFERLLFERE